MTQALRLQFTYKGRISTLQSALEIANWIEERKKRYPTKSRIAEKAERARQVREELQAARRDRELSARQNAEAKEKEKADAKATRKAEWKAKEGADAKTKKEGNFGGADYKVKKEINVEGPDAKIKNETNVEGADAKVQNEINFEKNSKDNSLSTNGRAEKAKLKVEKLQRQLRKVEERAARATAKADKLRAEAFRYGGVNQIKVPSTESTKVEGYEGTGTANIPMPKQGSEVVSDAIPLKEENLERLGHANGEVVLSGVDHTEAGDGALDSPGKLPDPLTPTSQPSIQKSLEMDHEHEAAADGIAPTEQASDVSRPSKDDDLGSLIDNANPQKPDDVAIESGFSVSTSLSSSISSLTDSEDETTSSDGSTSSASSSSAPDSRPSKRVQPDKVPPPKRPKKKPICRIFLRTGRCKKGDTCGFRHELPNRANHGGRRNKRVTKPIQEESKRRGIGLYQRVSDHRVTKGYTTQLLIFGQLVEQERAQEAFESRKAAADGGDNRPLDEAAKVAIPVIDEVAAK